MTFAASLASHVPRRPGPLCSIYLTLQRMSPEEAALLRAALDDHHTYGHQALARILRNEGWLVGRDAVGRHRNGDCACGIR